MYRTGVYKLTDATDICSEKWLALVEPERGYVYYLNRNSEQEANAVLSELVERYKHTGINHPDFDAQRRFKAQQQN